MILDVTATAGLSGVTDSDDVMAALPGVVVLSCLALRGEGEVSAGPI